MRLLLNLQCSLPAGLWTNQLESLPAEIGLMTNLQACYPSLAHLLTECPKRDYMPLGSACLQACPFSSQPLHLTGVLCIDQAVCMLCHAQELACCAKRTCLWLDSQPRTPFPPT